MNSATHEIPQDQWSSYLDNLSEQCQGWLVSVEAIDRQFGDQCLADRLPLQGLSFQKAGSEAGDIMIEMGDRRTGLSAHHIDHPLHVREVDARPGEEEDIEIEAQDGMKTLVRICRPQELPH